MQLHVFASHFDRERNFAAQVKPEVLECLSRLIDFFPVNEVPNQLIVFRKTRNIIDEGIRFSGLTSSMQFTEINKMCGAPYLNYVKDLRDAEFPAEVDKMKALLSALKNGMDQDVANIFQNNIVCIRKFNPGTAKHPLEVVGKFLFFISDIYPCRDRDVPDQTVTMIIDYRDNLDNAKNECVDIADKLDGFLRAFVIHQDRTNYDQVVGALTAGTILFNT